MSSPAMDVTPGLDDSQFITVKCRQCSSHYPLREINKHMLQCVKTSKCVGWESMDSHKDTVDDEILCLDSDDTSGDEFPDITKPPPKKGNGHFESKWNFVRLLAIILKVCRTEVARRKPFEEGAHSTDNVFHVTILLHEMVANNEIGVIRRKSTHIKNHPCNWINQKPSDLDKLILPINIDNCHWILCVIEFQPCIIRTYDSLNCSPHSTVGNNLL
ncbi:hypothetical protein GBAR_LOCUS16630 [Geodia barretti]|uniref:Ubiquitin-like protease family profile domain-containing protein n=1 Tax=Geodia barretti TaxID=519541 RepID=A0AA35WQQ1_GEOBA|nr:hypothetical protein GBAR_LOCUS16630 [Geodia barretti]